MTAAMPGAANAATPRCASRAEAAVALRPDGAQIKYVQENFLDILSELEDSNLVKINCD